MIKISKVGEEIRIATKVINSTGYGLYLIFIGLAAFGVFWQVDILLKSLQLHDGNGILEHLAYIFAEILILIYGIWLIAGSEYITFDKKQITLNRSFLGFHSKKVYEIVKVMSVNFNRRTKMEQIGIVNSKTIFEYESKRVSIGWHISADELRKIWGVVREYLPDKGI